MAWKAKTLANTLMTVALVRNLGALSAMIHCFGHHAVDTMLPVCPRHP